MKHFLLSIAAVLTLVLAGCRGSGRAAEVAGDTLTCYASALVLVDYPEYTAADVRVPWHEGYLARYVIPKHPGARLPEGRTCIAPDTTAIVSFSNVYTSALNELGALNRLCGVADAAYLPKGDKVAAMVTEGRVKNVGSSMSPTLEAILDLEPSLVLASPYESGGAVAQMQQAGLPIVLMADYVEQDPRGRAEWLRLIGRITDRSAKADSISSATIERYNLLAAKASKLPEQPRVITEKPMSGIWYVPGGESYVARLIADAGGQYVWADNQSTASVPMSLENVLDQGLDADIWLIKEAGDLTAQSLTIQLPAASKFKAMPDGVWVCNTLESDYYNDIVLHPDRILSDMIAIFHPQSTDADSLTVTYYHPLK